MTAAPMENVKEDKKPASAKPTKKRKRRNPLEPIKHQNPNDKLHCICTDVEWGQMVKCSNERCAIKLYHLDCVVLTEEPEEPWYCPICRDSDSRILNPSYASQDGSS
uniref:Inhibitor of growth protein 2 n=1 Tax=Lygus hesperus TaxID=30085 RepID=A0A0A9W1I1_LYGHE